MSIGPVELLVVKFPGNQFTGEIAPALAELVEGGLVRVIDILFVTKDSDGAVSVVEMDELDADAYGAFDPVVEDVTGLLSEEDIAELAAGLDASSSAAMMLFENVWATRFRDAVLAAKGELLLSERIPHRVVEQVLAARESADSAAI